MATLVRSKDAFIKVKQRPVPWVWKETEREPWAQLEEKPWTPQVSHPKLHLAGNSNPICTMPGSCRRDAPPLRWATWLFHLLFNSLVIWYVLGYWINFWTSLGFLSIFCSFPGGFFTLCEYWLFFPSPTEVQSWKIHGTSLQKSLWRTW